MSSAEFYDNFIAAQVASGINDRIQGLYERLCRMGLQSRSSVLEIGCGIGTLTYLLAKKIKTGRIEATDLSPQSIEYARKHIKADNLKLSSGNILEFAPQSAPFDFVLLFDVLEHIPESQHPALFGKISGWMNDASTLLINLPNPGYILYDQQHNPDALQELDQPIFLEQLVPALAAASLDIVQLETYSVWVKDDYQFFVIRKRKPFREELLSAQRTIFQKGMVWWKRKWRKLIYRYPPR